MSWIEAKLSEQIESLMGVIVFKVVKNSTGNQRGKNGNIPDAGEGRKKSISELSEPTKGMTPNET